MNDFFGGEQVTHSYESQAAEIYDSYPLKVGKPKAIISIIKAIKKWSFHYVLQRTQLFASTIGDRREFVPHPATWFNQHRFNDEPSTWERKSGIGDLKAQFIAVENLIQSHPANPESTSYTQRCNGIQRDELDDLKRKRLKVIQAIAKY